MKKQRALKKLDKARCDPSTPSLQGGEDSGTAALQALPPRLLEAPSKPCARELQELERNKGKLDREALALESGQ